MFRPYSKEQSIGTKKEKPSSVKTALAKPEKPLKPKKKKAPPKYRTSDGKTYTQIQIDNRRNKE
jgi:hypothetical protein